VCDNIYEDVIESIDEQDYDARCGEPLEVVKQLRDREVKALCKIIRQMQSEGFKVSLSLSNSHNHEVKFECTLPREGGEDTAWMKLKIDVEQYDPYEKLRKNDEDLERSQPELYKWLQKHSIDVGSAGERKEYLVPCTRVLETSYSRCTKATVYLTNEEDTDRLYDFLPNIRGGLYEDMKRQRDRQQTIELFKNQGFDLEQS